MSKIALIALAVLSCIASHTPNAAAQPPVPHPTIEPTTEPTTRAKAPPDLYTESRIPPRPTPPRAAHYRPSAAFGLAVLGTAAGFIAMDVGAERDNELLITIGTITMFIGPSLGHVYTRTWARSYWLTGLRGAAMLGVYFADVNHSFGLTMLSGLAFTGFTAFSIIDAPLSARRANRRAQRRLLLTPTTMRDHTRRPVTGLALAGQF